MADGRYLENRKNCNISVILSLIVAKVGKIAHFDLLNTIRY